jgi:site-specific DNA-cytosine methylase
VEKLAPKVWIFENVPGFQRSYTAYWTRGMTSIHPEENRFLSPRESARIQSFPDRFIFPGTTIENYTQICNAVPPLVARAYGRYLLKVLLGQEIPAIPWDCSHKTSNQLVALSKKEQNPIQLRLPI